MASDDRLSHLLDRLADYVLAHGLTASSLRPLARAAGTSDRMLLYYFADKDAVMAATLERIAARMTALLVAAAPPQPLPYAQLRTALAAQLRDPALWPYMRLWLDMAARAAHGDALYARIGESIGRGFLAWAGDQLACAAADRAGLAARLLTEIEGMVLLTSLGLGDAVDAALGLSFGPEPD
jgi:AcrR family transcriptional regulator